MANAHSTDALNAADDDEQMKGDVRSTQAHSLWGRAQPTPIGRDPIVDEGSSVDAFKKALIDDADITDARRRRQGLLEALVERVGRVAR
jgi:hypothetical protein